MENQAESVKYSNLDEIVEHLNRTKVSKSQIYSFDEKGSLQKAKKDSPIFKVMSALVLAGSLSLSTATASASDVKEQINTEPLRSPAVSEHVISKRQALVFDDLNDILKQNEDHKFINIIVPSSEENKKLAAESTKELIVLVRETEGQRSAAKVSMLSDILAKKGYAISYGTEDQHDQMSTVSSSFWSDMGSFAAEAVGTTAGAIGATAAIASNMTGAAINKVEEVGNDVVNSDVVQGMVEPIKNNVINPVSESYNKTEKELVAKAESASNSFSHGGMKR